MFKKTLTSALIVASVLGGLSATAQAHDGPAVIRDHRTNMVVRDHRTPRLNEVVIVDVDKLPCSSGYAQLWQGGYNSIQYTDCEGFTYGYTAIKNDMFFRAQMNAISGDLTITMLGFAH